MAICVDCGDEFSDKRHDLGYKICLKCGAEVAHKEILEKASRGGQVYSKGSSSQYLTEGMLKEDLHTMGRKV